MPNTKLRKKRNICLRFDSSYPATYRNRTASTSTGISSTNGQNCASWCAITFPTKICIGADVSQALDEHNVLAGVVISKLEPHRGGPMRGYIAMLATKSEHRGKGIATTLVSKAIDAMIERDADEIALETEETNLAAMKLYEKLGFLRSKKLHRYYLNGNSAYRLVLYLKEGVASIPTDYDPYMDLPPSAEPQENGPDLFSQGIV